MGFNIVASDLVEQDEESSKTIPSTVPADLVSDVFLAAGFTFQDSDVEKLLANCLQDINGEYSEQSLLDGSYYIVICS